MSQPTPFRDLPRGACFCDVPLLRDPVGRPIGPWWRKVGPAVAELGGGTVYHEPDKMVCPKESVRRGGGC